jgi:hypothetical protein
MAKGLTADGDDLLTYNALDTCATARVYREILKERDWRTPRVQRLHEVHVKLSKIGAELHTTGFLVLPKVRQRLVRQLTTLKNQRHDKLVKHVGQKRSPGFRGTDGDMRALLYRRHSKEGIQCYDISEPEEHLGRGQGGPAPYLHQPVHPRGSQGRHPTVLVGQGAGQGPRHLGQPHQRQG